MSINIVEEYWLGVLKRLQAEVDVFNRLIEHQGEKGTQNELSFARVIENLVPSRHGVGSGLIIDADGNYSSQTDVIVFNRADEPALMAQTNQVLFPVENVRACVEIKTSVTTGEIKDAAEKVGSVRGLRPRFGSVPPYAMLGYGVKAYPKTLANTLRTLADDVKPDLVCFIKAGLVAGRGDLVGGGDSSEYVVGLAELHETTDGRRAAGKYVQPPASWDDPVVLRDGSMYPIVKNGTSTVVVEPSRALLLFCDALVRLLQRREGKVSTLEPYIPDLARELTPVVESA